LIKLEKFEFGDSTRLIGWIPDVEFLMQWAGPQYSFPLTPEQLGITYQASQGKKPKVYMFRAVETKTSSIIGHIELINVNHTNKSGTLARVLIGLPEARKQGSGQKIITLALAYGFHKLHLEEIELGVYPFNKPAIALYKKLGFKKYKEVTYKTDFPARFHQIERMNLKKDTWLQINL